MTTLRTVAVHDVVRALYPREASTDRDELALVAGSVIDRTLSEFSHRAARGQRPTQGAMEKFGDAALDDELRARGFVPGPALLAPIRAELAAMLRAFRRSELFGLPRPKSRLVVVNESVGVYAQPDYWDGRARIFEMKSYRAIPPAEDVRAQLALFQLAFPNFEQRLVCLDRHARPPTVEAITIPPPAAEERERLLTEALRVGRADGVERVVEFVDNPVVRYTIREGPHTPATGPT